MSEDPVKGLLLSVAEMIEEVREIDTQITTVKDNHPELTGDVVGTLDGCNTVIKSMSEIIIQMNEVMLNFKDKVEGS